MGIDKREAFCIAAKIYRSGEWTPGFPNRNTIDVNGRRRTLRDICALVTAIQERLPNSTVDDLRERMHAQHIQLQEELVHDRSYATGAKCLLRLMDEREKELQGQQGRRESYEVTLIDRIDLKAL